MRYRRLGNSGLRLSEIGLGGWLTFGHVHDESSGRVVIDRAVDCGVNFFDTANVYAAGACETMWGRLLAGHPRSSYVLATKVYFPMGDGPNDRGLSRKHVVEQCEASLQRLQTDYIDLYQVHWPDEETPLAETLSTLDDLVRSGKVRYIGCSNYPAWLLMKSLWGSDANELARFDSIQPHYNYVHRAEFERETEAVCADQGIGVIPYSPLAGGFLTGKYRRDTDVPDSVRADRIKSEYMNEQGFAAIDKLAEVGIAHSATVAQTAIAWILANPTVSSAIIGANNADQLSDTMKGADIELSAEEKAALDERTAWA